MRHFISLILSTIIALPAMAQTDTIRLSRQECIDIALDQSPTIKVANLEIKRMDYSKYEVLANLFPSIDFSASYQRTIELQTISMNMGGQSQQFKMGMDNNWNMGFTASMPLINASLWKSISITDTQIKNAVESARASRIDMVNNINKAYYALLLAIDSRKVIQANYDLAKFNADLYAKQFEQGTASEYDVLRSSVQVKNVEPELLQADIAVKQCGLQLMVLMGMDNVVTLMPTVSLDDLKGEMHPWPLDGDYALEGNTTLRTLEINRELAKKNLTLQKLAWVPSLAAQFNFNWMAMSNGTPWKNQNFNPYSNVALALQVPIFNGTGRYQKVRQAKVQLQEIDFQRENLTNSLRMQRQLALENINKQARQIESSLEGVHQAEKAHQIMQKSFEIGAATYLNLRDSEMASSSAQLAYLQSIYNYLVSTSELEALLGSTEI